MEVIISIYEFTVNGEKLSAIASTKENAIKIILHNNPYFKRNLSIVPCGVKGNISKEDLQSVEPKVISMEDYEKNGHEVKD